jgi:hypothetical protein
MATYIMPDKVTLLQHFNRKERALYELRITSDVLSSLIESYGSKSIQKKGAMRLIKRMQCRLSDVMAVYHDVLN